MREVTLPSIERLIEDADLRAASITNPARDETFVRTSLETARSLRRSRRRRRGSLSHRDGDDGEGLPRRLGRHAAALRALRPAGLQAGKEGPAHRGAARRLVRPPPQPAPGLRPRQPPGRVRPGGVAQRAASPRRPRDRRVAAGARRAHGLRRPGRRGRHARARRRAPRLRRRSRADHDDRPVDGRGRRLGDRPPPPRAVRRAGARLRRVRLRAPGARRRAFVLRPARARAPLARAAGRSRGAHAGLHLPWRQGSDGGRHRFAPHGRPVQGARLSGKERPLHRVPERRPLRLEAGL